MVWDGLGPLSNVAKTGWRGDETRMFPSVLRQWVCTLGAVLLPVVVIITEQPLMKNLAEMKTTARPLQKMAGKRITEKPQIFFEVEAKNK